MSGLVGRLIINNIIIFNIIVLYIFSLLSWFEIPIL